MKKRLTLFVFIHSLNPLQWLGNKEKTINTVCPNFWVVMYTLSDMYSCEVVASFRHVSVHSTMAMTFNVLTEGRLVSFDTFVLKIYRHDQVLVILYFLSWWCLRWVLSACVTGHDPIVSQDLIGVCVCVYWNCPSTPPTCTQCVFKHKGPRSRNGTTRDPGPI